MTQPLVLAALLITTTAAAADKPDPRLATVHTAFVSALDELGDDKPVAACFAEHLSKTTPLTAVDTKTGADVLLSVRAHLPGNTSRQLTGGLGQAWLVATLPDGTVLWKGSETLQSRESLARQKAMDVPCSLADGLADKLRQGMRKARDAR